MSSLLRVLGSLLVLTWLAACSPKMPTVTPQVARVLWVSPTGVRLAIEVDVHNPNSFPLMADTIEGVIEVGQGSTLGYGMAYPRGTIPAEGAARLTTQVDVQWTNMGALAPFLMSPLPVPYVFKGKARIGGDGVSLAVPFEVNGQLTRAELIGAGLRAF
jgi:LEA14-like dessication related protein